MKFLRNLLAAILGCMIAFGIMFFCMMIFFAVLGSTDSTPKVKNNTILKLQLQQQIVDFTGTGNDDPFAGLFQKRIGLNEIVHAIQVAKTDSKIKGISLDNNFLLGGLSQTSAIRDALEDFKTSGKFVYAFADFYAQKDYYLASIADSIFLNPVGGLDFKGLASEVLYFKDLQEKSGVKMEVIRHGKYKSAVEPFIANEMSEANRTQLQELLGSLWGSIVEGVAEARDIPVANLNRIADTLGGRLPEMAKASGLVDGLRFRDQYEGLLKKQVEIDSSAKLTTMDLEDYITVANKKVIYKGEDRIAVIYAQGEILYGEGDQEYIGQGLITKAIRSALKDSKVKAIVMRVNSPGGSALTSDIIWRELELAKAKKPIVVSMGDVAASGGYYIAAGAHKIYAEPTTITGSIGVFGTIPNMSGLADKIGINAEQVGTNENAVGYSIFEPLDPKFGQVVKEGVEATYTTFLSRVAAGRGLSMAQVDSIAQGRVWSGKEAQELGLVDELGGLDAALAGAAALAEISDFEVRKFPKYKSEFERLMEDLSGVESKLSAYILQKELGQDAYSLFKQFKDKMDRKGVQVIMPYTLNIK